MTKAQIISRLLDPGIVAVVRVDSAAALVPICEALLAGGVTGLEITMTSPDAISTIADASKRFGDRALMGVGTVLDTETCRAAILAGAQFVVTPVCRPAIMEMCPALREARRLRSLRGEGIREKPRPGCANRARRRKRRGVDGKIARDSFPS